MTVWIIDSSTNRGDWLEDLFVAASCRARWVGVDIERAITDWCDGDPLKQDDVVLVHTHDEHVWTQSGLFAEHVFYFSGGSALVDRPDWIQRSVSEHAITLEEAREFIRWIETGRPENRPALLRGVDPHLDFRVALVILCQAYLAVASKDESVRQQIGPALVRMGWDESDSALVTDAIDVQAPEWWRQGLGAEAGPLDQSLAGPAPSPKANALIGAINAGQVAPPALVADAYLELSERLSTR